MDYLDNPAGRLHRLLSQLDGQSNRSLIGTWAVILDVKKSEVPTELGAVVAPLLKQIEAQVEKSGSRSARNNILRHREGWSRPIFPPDRGTNAKAVELLPGDEALEALDSVSETLHLSLPEGHVPERDQLDGLMEQLQELRTGVEDSELPEELKDVIAERLVSISASIDRVRFVGPSGVKNSIDELIGAIVVNPSPWPARVAAFDRVSTVISIVLSTFSIATSPVPVLESPETPLELRAVNLQPEAASSNVLPLSGPRDDLDESSQGD